ncbi:MAG: TolC family protein [Gammaproteobacteria bacterium]|nr:TolC family protein [Gammaproteobacteria bacterium]
MGQSNPFGLTIWALLLCASTSVAFAEEGAELGVLPEPLTLEYALSLSQNDHPDNLLAKAQLNAAVAEKGSVEGSSGLQTKFRGQLRWVEPAANSFSKKKVDNFIGLTASKRLYDFGYSEARLASAKATVDNFQWRVLDQQVNHRIAIMSAFFDVILADLAYGRDNELMAVAYVQFDRVKDQNKLGQVADVELLKSENTYHISRSVRYASDVKRRASRSDLSNILGHPGQLPSNLVRPELQMHKRHLPDVEELQKSALENNYVIKSLNKNVESARQQVLAARASKKPVFDLQLLASEYTNDSRPNDRLRAGIVFEMPLSTSGVIDAEIARQRSLLIEAQAGLRKQKMQLQQRVLELWQKIYIVKAQRDEALIFMEYRDLALDKNRALYELDVNSDLGDSLALFSSALYKMAKADFDLTLAWVQLDALLGKPVDFQVQYDDLLKK